MGLSRGVPGPERGFVGVHTKQPRCTSRVLRRKTDSTRNWTRQWPVPHTQTTAAQAAQDQHPRDPPGTTPSRGPERLRRGASPLPLPRRGPVAGRNEPRSRRAPTCSAQPSTKSGGASSRAGERHHCVGKANRSSESDRTGRGAEHQRGATRHAREALRRPQPLHTDRCQATKAAGCRKPWQRAQPATNHGTGRGAKPNPHTARPSQDWWGTSGARTRTHTQPNTPAKSGGTQPKPKPKHTHPHRTPQPGVAGYKRSAHTKTHTPQRPSQEWRAAAETRAQAQTPTPHTPARNGGVQAERAQKHTHTHPNAPARTGRLQPKPEPKHTPPHRTPQARNGGVQAERAHVHTHTRAP